MNEKELEFITKVAEITRTAKLQERKHAMETRQHEREVEKLNERIRKLENHNALLLDLLAQVMGEGCSSIVIREENFGHKHVFKASKNLAGEDVLLLVR